MIQLTDFKGRKCLPDDMLREPRPSSIVLTEGIYGTAWQRFFTDGLWHSTVERKPKTWADLLDKRNLALVYDAPERKEL